MTKLTLEQQAKVNELAQHGPVAILELRGQKVENKKWIGKTDGKPAEMWLNTLACEFAADGRQVAVELSQPKGETGPLEALPIQRGALIAVVFRAYKESFEGTTARALKIEPLTALELPKPPAKP